MSARKNSKRYFFIFLIASSLVFSPLDFSVFIQTPQVAGEDIPVEEIVGSVVWSENRVIQGVVSVPSNATLTIAKGTVIEFDNQSSIDVSGTLSIEGTPAQPVILKKKDSDPTDFYTVSAISDGKVIVRNADVSGGGSVSEFFMVMRPSLLKQAHAFWSYIGALGAQSGGTLDIEGVRFHDNPLAVYADNTSYFRTKVWRSKFIDNTMDVASQAFPGKVDVRYNWWGDTAGPALCVTECADRPRTYEKIIGRANFVDWATTASFKDPVIVIPGIMGSWRWTNSSDLVLDPIFGTYDELVETLDENGYTQDTDLFLFPYEWRVSNVETAKLLRTKIDAIKTATKWPRVDIVAHSMGGLVAREYIGSLNGGGNIDQLITLGTPHDGSPKSYLTWEGGDFSSASRFSVTDFFAQRIFEQEAEENNYDSVFDYVRNVPIASVRELLPTSAYLRDKDTDEMRAYPTLYPKNTFLENLKTNSNLSKLTPVLFSNIVGRLESDETISRLRVDGASIELLNNPEAVVLWGHGKPDGYDDLTGDRGLELGSGDGVVPLESANSIASDETIALDSNHGNLPTDGAKTAVKVLTGFDAIPSGALVYPTQSMLLFMPFSPIDIQIISPTNKRVGKNFETGGYYDEIPGAYYTGFDTENEFIALPNPEKGEYRVLTQGTGAGAYRVEVVHIEEGVSGQAEESVATIAGIAETGVEAESMVELKETGEVVAENTADTVAPTTTLTLSGTQGLNDWYASDMTVTLTATDNENGSGIEKTEYSLDNGTTWNAYAAPFLVVMEGTTTLQYFSTDKTGNKEAVKTATIQIDKTAPEGKVTFNPTTQKLDITGHDNLGGNVAVTVTELPIVFVGPRLKDRDKSHEEHRNKKRLQAMLTDESGHVTRLMLLREKQEKNELAFSVQSVSYDTADILVEDTLSRYQWQMNRKKQYQEFTAKVTTTTKRLESRYMSKKNETWVRERTGEREDDADEENKQNEKYDGEHSSEWQKFPGLVIPYLETVQGNLEIRLENGV